MSDPVALIYGEAYRTHSYNFYEDHPLQPLRVALAVELMRACELLVAPGVSLLPPRMATIEELNAVHDRDYLATVQALSVTGEVPPGRARLADLHGFGQADNPPFAGMHEAAALVAGGTLVGMEAVMEGRVLHAFVPAGGLHHAHRGRAAGFCIYNDPAVAIAAARDRFGARVAYVDVDAHHGDGVQEAFYDDSRVLTISLHESGRYLFPGTGFVEELGEGAGKGYSVNVPLEPYTGDAPFLRAVDEVVVPLLRDFKPDLLLTQCGCDSHWLDPLTHLATSTNIWPALARTFHSLAHELCAGRWLATGGGGYDLYSVVPRAWTMLFAGMVGAELPAHLPQSFLELRAQYSEAPMDLSFASTSDPPIAPELRQRVSEATDRIIVRVRDAIFPLRGLRK